MPFKTKVNCTILRNSRRNSTDDNISITLYLWSSLNCLKSISFVTYFKFTLQSILHSVKFTEYEPQNVSSCDKTGMNSTQGDKAALMDNPTN